MTARQQLARLLPLVLLVVLVIAGLRGAVSAPRWDGPLKADGSMIVGKVGAELDLAGGYAAAKQTGLAILASLRANLGDLNRVRRVVKTLGMVNCASDFQQQPQVINGFSELFAEVFGKDLGVGARSAVGMGSLPGNIAVEVEVILEIE